MFVGASAGVVGHTKEEGRHQHGRMKVFLYRSGVACAIICTSAAAWCSLHPVMCTPAINCFRLSIGGNVKCRVCFSSYYSTYKCIYVELQFTGNTKYVLSCTAVLRYSSSK